MKAKVTTAYKPIVSLFEKLSGSRSMWQVFNDCIEIFALCFQNQFLFGKRYNENEERYKQIIKQYSEQEMQTITQIFAELINMAEQNPFRDLLGDLYMQLNMGSDALGQFFTPYSVAFTMAKSCISIEQIENQITDKGYITINEPTCGGGANVIAFCEYLYKHNINYQSQCVIVCQDLSRLTALMCYVVLSLLGCSAVVKIGDTLSNPYTNYRDELKRSSEIWTTPMFHFYNCYSKV